MGEYEGVTFVVSEGSEATFTVTEKLASLSLPNDAGDANGVAFRGGSTGRRGFGV